MTRRTIGGHLDVNALAKLYRPADPPTLRAAAVEMLPALEEEARKRELAGKGADGSGGRGNQKKPYCIRAGGFPANPQKPPAPMQEVSGEAASPARVPAR
jgi:hypothetical protein